MAFACSLTMSQPASFAKHNQQHRRDASAASMLTGANQVREAFDRAPA